MTSANLLAEDRALSIRSDIRTKSLPDSPFVRRGWSRGAKVSLKQSVGDFEHLPEVTPHLLAFQARNNAGAAKAMNQARANGHRRQRIALLKSDQPAKSKTHRSEEHTSELQSLMRNSYAVFCLKKKKKTETIIQNNNTDN